MYPCVNNSRLLGMYCCVKWYPGKFDVSANIEIPDLPTIAPTANPDIDAEKKLLLEVFDQRI